jgi:hypothetical protein
MLSETLQHMVLIATGTLGSINALEIREDFRKGPR